MDFYKDVNGYFVIGGGKYPTGLYFSRISEDGKIDIIPISSSVRLPSYSNISITSLRKKDGTYYVDELDISPVIGEMVIGISSPLSINGELVNDSNPLPVLKIDASGKTSSNTVFSETIIGKRVPQITLQFQYPIENSRITHESINGGSYSQQNSMLYVSSNNETQSYSKVSTVKTLRYIPGYEIYSFFSVGFNNPVEGQDQLVGIFDDNTGFGIGYHGLDFVFFHKRDGVYNYRVIDLNTFNSNNGYTLDPTMGNVYRITFGYLGFAGVTVEVLDPGNTTRVLCKFEYPNTQRQTHLSQTFIPFSLELKNNEGSIPMSLFLGSINCGVVDGSGCSEYEFARFFTYKNLASTPITTSRSLVVFRNNETFGGIENRISARIAVISSASDLNKNARWYLFKNPVITNTPTWEPFGVDSTLDFSNDAAVDFSLANDFYLSWNTAKVGSFFEQVSNLHIDLEPGEEACFYLSTSGTGEVDISINWWELF